MRCLIYSRVSTDAQERDGTSLETQEEACERFASSAGWMVTGRIRDAASGYSLERPGLTVIRDSIARGDADVVLSYAVDRLSRNQNHIGVLFDEANGYSVKLDFVTEKFEDTAVGRFILAARAFVAEVEREKIVERTQRGKTRRAHEGKLPQATGRGIYGYRYLSTTGHREIDSTQAPIVQRIFESFASGASCNRLAVELNRECIPAFSGGSWYPLTIRRILLNEAYTGRTIFRRTRAEKYRDGRSGKAKRRIVERAQEDWIELPGVTPQIVSTGTFERVQEILNDPDRRGRSRSSRNYPLTGRLRCAACGAPMVGQVLMKGRYSYYRCKSSYVGREDSTCPSKYIRTDAIESQVRQTLIEMLADPDRLLSEARALQESEASDKNLSPVMDALKDVESRQRRLVRLFTEGGLPYELLEQERAELSRRRADLESERTRIEATLSPTIDYSRVKANLPAVLQQIKNWVNAAEGEDFTLLLAAVDVRIVASNKSATISGSVPAYEPSVASDLATIERTSA